MFRKSINWLRLSKAANVNHLVFWACCKCCIVSKFNKYQWCCKNRYHAHDSTRRVPTAKQRNHNNWKNSPEWNANCCLHSHVPVSQRIAVLSKLPVRRRSPLLFHCKEKIDPVCFLSISSNFPVILIQAQDKTVKKMSTLQVHN